MGNFSGGLNFMDFMDDLQNVNIKPNNQWAWPHSNRCGWNTHNHVGHPAAAMSLFKQIGHENLHCQENLTNNRLPNLLINMKAPYQLPINFKAANECYFVGIPYSALISRNKLLRIVKIKIFAVVRNNVTLLSMVY